ncbi:MAG TPA: hypothetical protein VH834_23385 [Solirubrobacteraceae bacterium]
MAIRFAANENGDIADGGERHPELPRGRLRLYGRAGRSARSSDSATSTPPAATLSALALDKRVSPDTVVPGDQVTYVLTVRNNRGVTPPTQCRSTTRCRAA